MDPLVYVVILNWKRPDDTAECIESVMASSYRNCHIVVVDNGSDDGSVNLLRGRFREATVLETGHNLGFAGGMNLGIEHALARGAEHVLILNNDAVVDSVALGLLVEAITSHQECGIVGPTVLSYLDRDKVSFMGGKRHWYWPAIVDFDQSVRGVVSMTIPLDVVSGCAMLVKASVFRDIGLLDTMFFMYYEDTDFCLRARAKGYLVEFVPAARVWHKISASTEGDAARRVYLRARSKAIFYRRYARGMASITTWPFLAFGTLWTVTRSLAHRQPDGSRYYLTGLMSGLRSKG
ncbi:MAG: glycosyltransferase family 2 protein [Chloroflexi bacterium]|nr:glycosyltransferase family 2 protein [Chloroflexota bacterium]